MTRQCGECQLCCKLLPMKEGANDAYVETKAALIKMGVMTRAQQAETIREFFKPAGARCPHQRHHKGCAVYDRRPFGCRVWSCRWLMNDDAAELSRPDRAHYVIDMTPDFVTMRNNETGAEKKMPVVQVWLDAGYPHAYRDPALLAFLERRAERDGHAALIRLNNREAFFLLAPAISPTGEWGEIRSGMREKEHTFAEKVAAIGDHTIMVRL
jgi:hypothetical protein